MASERIRSWIRECCLYCINWGWNKTCYFVEKSCLRLDSTAVITFALCSRSLVHSLCNIRYLVCGGLKCDPWPRSLSCKTVALFKCTAWWCAIFSVMDTISFELVTALQVNYLQLGGKQGLLITHDTNAAVCLLHSFHYSVICIHFLHFKHLFE